VSSKIFSQLVGRSSRRGVSHGLRATLVATSHGRRFLTVYKPNFCADCGERVLRERWRAWTSRKFCPACEKHFRRGWVAPLVFACALVASGFAVGRLMRPAPPPLVIARGELPVPTLLAKNLSGATNNATTVGAATGETTDGATRRGRPVRRTARRTPTRRARVSASLHQSRRPIRTRSSRSAARARRRERPASVACAARVAAGSIVGCPRCCRRKN
jgi:hypothetical protein